MSQKLVDRNPDLKRLRDDGYNIRIDGANLIVGSVPYVNAACEIKRATLIFTLKLQQDRTTRPEPHWLSYVGEVPGEVPCNEHGTQLEIVIDVATHPSIAGMIPSCRLSTKPKVGFYDDYYHQVTTYVKILEHQAQAIDPSVNARVFLPVQCDDDDDSPFLYYDTASSRAGISDLSRKLAMPKVAIVGVGGTGSYVLDFVAKTLVREIHLFDDDEFKQHNAFRCPGAVSFEELTPDLTKLEYYHQLYARLRRGIVPHPYRIDPSNASELVEMSFVFLCLDSGEYKDAIMRTLEAANVPFIDVGMGIEHTGDELTGLLRVTTSTATMRSHIRENQRVSFAKAQADNLYSRGIQVAELNALNAALAVIRWKKYCHFYHDLKGEHHSIYAVSTNKIFNEDL
jgi:tRNA A37 threonylcarbamoyladenosine dehydratase